MQKERRELGGIMDWFKRKAAQERGLSVPSGQPLPAPSIFDAFKPRLPAERKEGAQLPAAPTPEAPKKRGGLLSIFDIFAPTPPKEPTLPAVREEPVTMAPIPWEELFTPPSMMEEPIQEMIVPPPPIQQMLPTDIFTSASQKPGKEEPKYTFIRLPRLQVGQWVTPTPNELGAHFQSIFNTEAIFNDLREMRKTGDWAQSITDHARVGMPLSVQIEPVVYKNFFTDFAKLYGIPWNVMESYLAGAASDEEVAAAEEAVFHDIVGPMNQRVGEAFEVIKPPDLPGWFWVGQDPKTRAWWLHYIEAMLGPFKLTGRAR